MQRMIERLLMIGIICAAGGGTAFLVSGVIFPYVFGKLLWMMGGSILILSILIYARFKNFDTFHISRVTMVVAGLTFVQIIWLIFSIDVWHSLWGSDARGIGVVFSCMVTIMLVGLDALPPIQRMRTLKIVTLVALVPMMVAFQSVVREGLHRVEGTLGNSILMGNYMLFVGLLGFLWTRVTKGREQYVWIVFTVLSSIALLLTETRGAMLAGVAAVIAMGIFWALQGTRKHKIIVGGVLGGILILGSVAYIGRGSNFVGSIPALYRITNIGSTSESDEQRPLVWKTALAGIKERPWFGYGGEQFEYVFDRNYDPKLTQYGFSQTWSDRAHNIFLDTLVMYGILGTLLLMGLVGYGLYSIYRGPHRIVVIGGVVAYGVQALFEFDGPANLIIIAMLASTLASLHREKEQESIKIPHITIIPLIVLAAGLVWSMGSSYRASAAVSDFIVQEGTPTAARDTQLIERLSAISPFNTDLILRASNTVFEHSTEITDVELIDGMIRLVDIGITREPHRFSLQIVKAHLYLRKGIITHDAQSFINADKILFDAQTVSPRRQSLRAQRANIAILQGNIEKAIMLQKEAVDLDPTIPFITYRYLFLKTNAEPKDAAFSELFAFIKEQAETSGYLPTTNDELTTIAAHAITREDYEMIAIIFAQKAHLKFDVEASLYNVSVALKILPDPEFHRIIQRILGETQD